MDVSIIVAIIGVTGSLVTGIVVALINKAGTTKRFNNLELNATKHVELDPDGSTTKMLNIRFDKINARFDKIDKDIQGIDNRSDTIMAIMEEKFGLTPTQKDILKKARQN